MSDITVSQTNANMTNFVVTTKPPYLVELLDGKSVKLFLTIDAPVIELSHIRVKGLFVSEKENLNQVLSELDKTQVMEILFPWHRVQQIKNLSFKIK